MCNIFNKIFKRENKKSVLKGFLKNPDEHIFTLEVVDEEIVIRIKKKEKEDGNGSCKN